MREALEAAVLAVLLVLLFLWGREQGRKERACILRLLMEGGEWYALDLVEASGGVLGQGTVFLALSDLERSGKIVGWVDHPDHHGIQRRVYKLVD